MVGGVIHPHHAMLFGPEDYQVISEMSPFVSVSSFSGGMSPEHLLFKAQDSVLGGSMQHGIGLQPSSGCFHHCDHIALALVGLWQCDIINLPSLPLFTFQPWSPMPERLYLLGLLECNACFTFVDNLCDSVHGQVHPSVMSPSVYCISSLMA